MSDKFENTHYNKLKNAINSVKYYYYKDTYYNSLLFINNVTRIDFDYEDRFMRNILYILVYVFNNKKLLMGRVINLKIKNLKENDR